MLLSAWFGLLFCYKCCISHTQLQQPQTSEPPQLWHTRTLTNMTNYSNWSSQPSMLGVGTRFRQPLPWRVQLKTPRGLCLSPHCESKIHRALTVNLISSQCQSQISFSSFVRAQFCFAPDIFLSILAITKVDIFHVNVGQTCTIRILPIQEATIGTTV